MSSTEVRVPFEELHRTLTAILVAEGFEQERAAASALLFAEASRDGVHSHGLNRFPRFVRNIRDGLVDPSATPVKVSGDGAVERWDGRRGPGNLNARFAMARAIALARERGIGCVALRNTNHWMRAGSYGWQAAEAGMIGICWTNTLPNLPPWGSERPLLGNNPLVIAVPRPGGHVVLDMAMSQFSYGSLAGYARSGRPLPVPGGHDENGELTRDAAAILRTGRPLPTGYWKGSGLAMLLDIVAATLAGGRATCDIEPDFDRETEISQVFLAIPADGSAVAERVIAGLREEGVRYPGERVLRDREESLRRGVLVDPEIWNRVREEAATLLRRPAASRGSAVPRTSSPPAE